MEAIQKKIDNYVKECIMLYATKVSEKFEEKGVSYKELLEIADEQFKNMNNTTSKKQTSAKDLKERCIELGIKPMRKKDDMIKAIEQAEKKMNKPKQVEVEEEYESE